MKAHNLPFIQPGNSTFIAKVKSVYQQNFGQKRIPTWLIGMGVFVAGLAAVTPFYIFLRMFGADRSAWLRLLQSRLWTLMGNTLLLVFAVTGAATIIGVGLAWLTERSDLPGRKIFRWLFALPLAIPAYIGAIIHLSLFRPRGGLVPQALETWLGYTGRTPSPTGFGGAFLVLTLFSFPYVYLLSGAAFRSLHASLVESARILGCRPWKAFFSVVLPIMRPGITAGALLIALDVLAEYGTVALLRFETFSSAIFVQLSGRYNRSAAVVLSGVLILIAFLFLWAELRLNGKARFTQIESNWRESRLTLLRRWKIPAVFVGCTVVFASLVVPLGILTHWSVLALSDYAAFSSIVRTGSQTFGNYIANSLTTSLMAAGAAVILSLPVAILAVRYPGKVSRLLSKMCQVGYAIPGVVTALSVVLLINRLFPFFYATPLVLVLAYVLRYLPQAVRSSESSLNQVSPSLEEASRTLGKTHGVTFWKVSLPLIMPGILAGGALVFLSSIKELPATLLLRPAGFDTLAVRVWMWSHDGFYLQAAPAAIFLVIISIIPLALLLRKVQVFR